MQEVVYAWTIPTGWKQYRSNATGDVATLTNILSIVPINGCSSSGIVKVKGSFNAVCGAAAESATANIQINRTNPVTIGVPAGYVGSHCGDTNSVTFTANGASCATNYAWSYPTGWTKVSSSGNSITLKPKGDQSDSGTISVNTTLSCGTVLQNTYSITFNSPSLSISGPATMCSTGSYSVLNLPAGAGVAWSVTQPGIVTVAQNGNGVTLTKIKDGAITLSATMSAACNTPTLVFPIYVGLPAGPASLSKNINSPPFCIGMEIYVTINPVAGASSYSWVSNSGNLGVEGSYIGCDIYAYGPGKATFTISAINNCGSSNHTYIAMVSNCNGGGPLLTVNTFPNPASDELSIIVADSTQLTRDKLDNPVEIILSDRMKDRKSSLKTYDREFKISTSNLPEDVYYLNVIYKDVVIQRQIVIKR